MCLGIPGKVRRDATKDDKKHIEDNWKEYLHLVAEYREQKEKEHLKNLEK